MLQSPYTTPYLAVDTETTGLEVHQGDLPFAISMTTWEGEDFYFRFEVDPLTREVAYDSNLINVLWTLDYRSRHGLPTAFHNASFDLGMLYAAAKQAGLDWNPLSMKDTGKPIQGILDTVIIAHAVNSARGSYRLKPLCESVLGIMADDEKALQASTVEARRLGKPQGFKLAKDVEADYHLADKELCKKYAIRDTQRVIALLKAYLPLLEKPDTNSPFARLKPIIKMEHELQLAVLEMNLRGVRVDKEKIKELTGYYEGEIGKQKEKLAEQGFAELNPKSSKQKIDVFYNQLGFDPIRRKRKGKDGEKKLTVTVDKNALASMASTSPLASALLSMSEAQHQLNSFILPLEKKAQDRGEAGYFVYPNFNSVGPATGRLSCSGINLQNITSSTSPSHKTDVELRARECYIPRQGMYWLLADYAQVEIWVAAFLSKDPIMCQTLLAGDSVHDITCDRVFGHKENFKENRSMYRKLAKILTFSILYGSGPKALSDLLNVSYNEAKIYYDNFWKTYKGLRTYSDKLVAQIKKLGYVHDMFGRVFFLEPNVAYKALNYVVQGSAAGILKRAHLAVYDLLKEEYPDFKIILSIHDECVVEGPAQKFNKEFVDKMQVAMSGDYHKLLGMPNPFKVGFSFVTKNWGKKINYEEA